MNEQFPESFKGIPSEMNVEILFLKNRKFALEIPSEKLLRDFFKYLSTGSLITFTSGCFRNEPFLTMLNELFLKYP